MSILLFPVLFNSAINFNIFFHQGVFNTNPYPSDFSYSLDNVIFGILLKPLLFSLASKKLLF